MAAAGSEIERQFGVLRERSDRLEVGSLTVDRAFDIGFRSRAELRLDDSLMGLAHHQLLSVRAFCALNYTVTRLDLILLQVLPCLKRIRGVSWASSFALTVSVCGQRRRLAGGEPPVSRGGN